MPTSVPRVKSSTVDKYSKRNTQNTFFNLSISLLYLRIRKQLEKLVNLSGQNNSIVLRIIITAAMGLVLFRLGFPFEVNWDLGNQLEAAHRLVKGLGLTNTYWVKVVSHDLNQEPMPLYLTYFPPTFSLIIAGLLALKLPLDFALKITYSLVTLVGWLGWGLVAASMLNKPIRLFSKPIHWQYAIAVILPIFFTPEWSGTDIFLWAGIPWIVLLLSQAISTSNLKFLIMTGLIFGLLYSFRYSSLFLVFSIFLILIIAYFPRIKTPIVHFGIFLGASLTFILPIYIYNRLVQQYTLSAFDLSSSGFNQIFESFFTILKRVGNQLPHASILFGFPVREIIYGTFPPGTTAHYLYGIVCLFILFLLPLWVKCSKTGLNVESNILLGLACLPISLVLFLTLMMFFYGQGYTDFLQTERYYVVINICFILAFYRLASLSTRNWAVELIASIFVVGLIFHYGLYRPADLWSGRQALFVKQLLGDLPTSIISPTSSSISNSLRQAVKKLQQDNPDAIFFTFSHPFYTYDGSEGFRVILRADAYWQSAYVSKPTKVFWVTNSVCTGICSTYSWKNVEQISSLPYLKTVFVDPDGKGSIFRADLPAGFKFGSHSSSPEILVN
jgi:hypothetical protein